jgi:gliding motility-associated-like protein
MKTFFSILIFLSLSLAAHSQQKQGAWWMFGDSLTINFNRQPMLVDTGRTPGPTFNNFSAANATISDARGKLLFYTNGEKVNNRHRQTMPNGFLYKGTNNTGSHANLIVDRPGSSHEYYFFNVFGYFYPGPTSLTYNLVDMRLDSGRGDVVVGMKNVLLKPNAGEQLTVLLHANNTDYWLVASSKNLDTIYTYPITSSGISSPIITPLPFSLVSCINGGACEFNKLKSSPDSEWLAANNKQGVELFKFNRATGAVTPYASLLTGTIPARVKVMSIAFSADNSKLYAGENDHNPVGPYAPVSNLYQFDLSAGSTVAAIQASRVLVDSLEVHRIQDMQLGINGKLYILPSTLFIDFYPQQNWLSIIHCPDLKAPACRFQKQGLKLYGRFGGTQLPTLNQTLFRNAHMLQALAQRDTICYGDSVQLSAFGAAADRFRWFPSGTADTLASPFVKPLQTTTYTVIGFSACWQDTAQVTVTVPPPLAPKTITGPTSVCPGVQQVSYRLTNPLPGERYHWGVKGGTVATAFGDSVTVNWNTLNPSASVWVVPQNSQGCYGDSTFLPVQVELALATPTPVGPIAVCGTGKAEQYQVQPAVNGSVYTWGIGGGSILSGQGSSRISVIWQGSGNKKLWVQETSQTLLASCRGLSDTLHVSLLPADATKLELLSVSVDSVDEAVVNIRYRISPDSLFPVTNLNLERQSSGSWQTVAALPLQIGNASEAGINATAQSLRFRLQSLNRCDSVLYSLQHSTILLKAIGQNKNQVTLKWSAYKGWEMAPVRYEIWQKTEHEAAYKLLPDLTTTDTSATAIIAGIGFKPCYRVKAIGNGEQSWSNSVCLEVENLPEFYNIITPDHDGLNDSFIIKNLPLYPNSRLHIYNRWGREVFSSDDYQNNWQGGGQSSGIYFYRLTTANGSSYSGWVEVVK